MDYKLIRKNDLDQVYLMVGDTIHTVIDKASADYKFFEQWMAEGNTPQPADLVPAITQLRWRRNDLLRHCDIPWGLADYSHPNKNAWLEYRQALRDLPANSQPELDENERLTNVVWPTPPGN